ncbi:glucosaminidase domain-containing protein [Clostridium sp. SHJSY1]|uniref:glucosaminidase domain-containing protein n=1 Tax=Clostridium sp. SHJSY1 TaxID=2942483 RepID=UPI0028767301|nr:glucosaminidase domain-containing protein [Clostridium sp. SHJSY1]MDS0525614.1 glucosaminidase domain-containing protein [Clostridium sp. SHJSY1]
MNMRKNLIFLLISVISLSNISVKAADITSRQKYEKRVVETVTKKSLSSDGNLMATSEDKVQLDEAAKEKLSYEVLVPKTNSNYEVTLAYSDGSYSYVGKSDSYDEAVKMAQGAKESLTVNLASITPTVIDSSGQVVYATEAIGRVWKAYSDSITYGRDVLSYVYSSSTLSLASTYTYIHDGYISEVPLIENRENEAKVLVAGYEGWMNKNINRDVRGSGYPNRDLLIQPISQVTNPSYYTVSNGLLKHFISISMTTVGKGNMRTIGVAPSYLKEGQTYYSYDGNYFYDGSQGMAKGLITLTTDLQNGNHNNSVNLYNPYYNYYNNLPFRTRTNYTAAELDSYINNKTVQTSKLRGLGQAFKDAESTYGVNALLALSVAMNESARGTSDYAMNRNNLFGLNATDNNTDQNTSYYSTPTASVMEFARAYISKGYTDTSDWRYFGGFLGNKKLGANVKYASDPFWSEKAVSFAMEAEVYLSGGNISNMKDYDYYQLIRYTGSNSVKTLSGTLLYSIQTWINPGYGSFVGGVSAISAAKTTSLSGVSNFQVNPERTTPNTLGDFGGTYDWNIKGYVSISNVEFINKGKSGFKDEDINFDGNIDIIDLSQVGQFYNSKRGEILWNSRFDINGDGIVDIYDVVKVSTKL